MSSLSCCAFWFNGKFHGQRKQQQHHRKIDGTFDIDYFRATSNECHFFLHVMCCMRYFIGSILGIAHFKAEFNRCECVWKHNLEESTETIFFKHMNWLMLPQSNQHRSFRCQMQIFTCRCAWSMSAWPNCSMIRLHTVDWNAEKRNWNCFLFVKLRFNPIHPILCEMFFCAFNNFRDWNRKIKHKHLRFRVGNWKRQNACRRNKNSDAQYEFCYSLFPMQCHQQRQLETVFSLHWAICHSLWCRLF